MPKPQERGVSLRPDDQIVVGLFSSGPATIKDALFATYDYGGKMKPVPVLLVTYSRDGEEDYEQPYSVGSGGWRPSDDGARLLPKAGQTGLPTTCNASLFFNSLRDTGFPMDRLDDEVGVLAGLDLEVIRVPQPKREGLEDSKGGREKTILLVRKILRLPWEKSSRRGAKAEPPAAPEAKRAAKQPPLPPEEERDTLEADATAGLLKALEEAGGTLKVRTVEEKVFATLRGNPDRKAIAAHASAKEFLEREDGWTFDGKVVELAG